MTSLKRAAGRGTFWSALSTIFSRGLRFVTTIVLARFLVPADFGLYAMAMLVIDIAEMLRDLGLGAALIQKKQLDDRHLTTCFWANEAIGIILWLITVAIAPAAAHFYKNPEVEPVLKILAMNFLISPLGSIPWVLLNRELRFKELMVAQTIATVARGASALVLAWRGFGVWSLVWAPLISTAVGSVVNWGYCRWRPSFGWSWAHFGELLHFGKGIFGGRLLGYFSANSDYLMTGRFLGAQMLGYYNFSYELPHLAETQIVPVVTRVLFPVLSQIQDDVDRLRRGYLQSMRWIAMVSMPFAMGMCLTAPELIPTLYGAKWLPVVVPLQILCWAGLAHALTSTVWTVQQSVGRSTLCFWWNAATLPLTIGALAFSVRWGITGVAATMCGLAVVLSTAIQHITNRMIRLRWDAFLDALRVPAVASAGMGLIVAVCRAMLLARTAHRWMTLIGSVGVGLASYVLLLLLVDRGLMAEVKSLLLHRHAPAPTVTAPDVELKATT